MGFGVQTLGDVMASDNVQTFTDGNFEDTVIKAGGPVLVDFWAEWCGPCKRLGPTVDALATDYAGKVTIGKLNVDENPQLAMKYQITWIPAMKVFQGGEVKTTIIGAKPKPALEQDLAAFIG